MQHALTDFADPKPYTVSVDDVSDFLDQLERIWSKNDPGTKIPRKAMCDSRAADRITQPSHRRRSSGLRLQQRM
jgi:hypothetical protein